MLYSTVNAIFYDVKYTYVYVDATYQIATF